MYEIPKTFDLSPLVGQILRQICIGQYDFQFHFEGWTIKGQGKVEIDFGAGSELRFNGRWLNTSGLDKLFGSAVASWGIDSSRSFHVALEDEAVIYFKDESDQHESFSVEPAGWII